ncbi:MAG: hypothetical protein WB949_06420 [Candidatus Acidiferrales bacterium]
MNPSARHRWLLAVAFSLSILMGLGAAPLADAGVSAVGATITFRKVFKSSYPEYVEIKVSDSGSGTSDIRQLDDESHPRAMQIDAALVQTIFDLASKLHNFDGVDLEMHRRIANLGEKTFGYERGAETHRVTFNYTLNSVAAQLLDIFEGLARQQTDLSDLDRTMHYDPLGVNDVILQIEKDLDHKLLPEPGQLLPLLDRLAADQHFIDIARERARKLAGRIRSTP